MNAPAEIIRREIAERGVLSFARFMELALYCPNSGYYEAKNDSPGRRGDFFTSVSVGELFGQLLAFQFADWLDELSTRNPQPLGPARRSEDGSTLNIVEAGAHDGTLAGDILAWLRSNRPGLCGQIQYVILEPSPRRQQWQKETLQDFNNVRWLSRFNDSTNHPDNGCRGSRFNGVIFSNELLDAMPVRRFGWDARSKRWFEWGVALEGEKFVWAKIPAPHSALRTPQWELPSSLLDVLPDGYTIETCPAAGHWWREAACALGNGKLVTIDYGLTNDEWFSPCRARGTLRAYFRHHATEDLLANVGEQDLTAHVNFSAIQTAGESAGLTTESFLTQAQFMARIAEKIFQNPESFGGWGAKQNRQFQTLTHPEHLGGAFRVLVQSKQGAP